MWPFSRKKNPVQTSMPVASVAAPVPATSAARANTLPAVVPTVGTSTLAKPVDVRTENIKSIISAGEEIAGNLRLQHGIKIAGIVTGDIHFGMTDGMLVLMHNGCIRGNIMGPRAIVAGEVWGNIVINGRLIILPTARIHGDIAATSLQTHEGASIDGRICTVQDLLEQQRTTIATGQGACDERHPDETPYRADRPMHNQQAHAMSSNEPTGVATEEDAPIIQFCVGGARR